MFVKGTAYHARRALLIRELGEARWEEFLVEYASKNKSFPKVILPLSVIDVTEFIRLNDAVISRFFDGEMRTYLRFGEESAEWALKGPYKRMLLAQDYERFIKSQSTVFSLYYSEGEADASLTGDVVTYRVRVPAAFQHVYLEYSPVGYLRRGIELTGRRVKKTDCVQGFSLGDAEIHYRLTLEAPADEDGES